MNGQLKQVLYGVIAAIFMALSGWTLNRVNDLSNRVTKAETEVSTLKEILSLWATDRGWNH